VARRKRFAAAAGFVLDQLSVASAAAYSLRKLRAAYAGSAIRVRRSSDNTEADIGFTAAGDLDLDALTAFCGAPRRPLDVVTGSAAAYSLRLLRTAYTGPCIRVRRSSDNVEADIGFTDAGDLDTVALLAFTGANSGFVTVWYDQSGSARHAIQTTAANQPRIVNAGVVQTLNGLPTVDQVTINGKLNIPAFSGMTSTIVSAVYAQATTNNGFAPWQLAGSTPVDNLPFTDGIAYAGPFSTTRPTFSTWAAAANELIIASAVQTGTALGISRNGTQNGTTATSITFTLPTTRTIFGGSSGTGFVSELIVMSAWDGGPTNRQRLERSQAAYFGVTHADPISGFVTAWYDQSGSGRNATQTTAANQPRIVNAGVVHTLNGRPTVDQVSTGRHMIIPSFSGMTSATVGAVYAQSTANNASSPWLLSGGTIDHMPWLDATAYCNVFSATRPGFGLAAWGSVANNLMIATAVQTGTALAIYKNGVQVGSTQNTTFTLPTARRIFGGDTGTSFVAELIVLSAWDGGSTNRQTLEQNQGAYYGVTGVSVGYLIVAGGGGGSVGGGGAGGLLTGSSSIAIGSYPVVVGAGGAGAVSGRANAGSDGSSSSWNGLTAIGGGGGGAYGDTGAAVRFGRNGGSGGGGGGLFPGETSAAGGTGTAGQGNAGGASSAITNDIAGGGGGAGGAGVSGDTTGNGGAGTSNSISGTSVIYGGGGGGGSVLGGTAGSGGTGGGGNGGERGVNLPTAGTANLGGGGGGAGGADVPEAGAAGGSGVVIHSYPTGSMTATGGTITTSGGNTIHTFTTSGTFTRTA